MAVFEELYLGGTELIMKGFFWFFSWSQEWLRAGLNLSALGLLHPDPPGCKWMLPFTVAEDL